MDYSKAWDRAMRRLRRHLEATRPEREAAMERLRAAIQMAMERRTG